MASWCLCELLLAAHIQTRVHGPGSSTWDFPLPTCLPISTMVMQWLQHLGPLSSLPWQVAPGCFCEASAGCTHIQPRMQVPSSRNSDFSLLGCQPSDTAITPFQCADPLANCPGRRLPGASLSCCKAAGI
uniref:Uncharacterized protein n=1 Tax=Pipistrellus kuhlii TaxID=59472 RepID=A0A7J7ZJR3_PIPKU|nr:hypothetical protein mPipKuh1_009578 [Pipistrellus kuhlii]